MKWFYLIFLTISLLDANGIQKSSIKNETGLSSKDTLTIEAKNRALKFLEAIERLDLDLISKMISSDGVTLTDFGRFGAMDSDEIHLSKSEFLNAIKNSKKIIKSYSADEENRKKLTLKEYLKSLHKSSQSLKSVEIVDDLRGLDSNGDKYKTAIIWWRGKNHYEDLAMIVILKKYRSQWFVVALAKECWRI
jgi:hypothetical protein